MMRFQKVHKMSVLRGKTDVRDLNSVGYLASLSGHEHWPLRPFANPRPGALANAFPLGGALRCGVAHPTFRLSPAAYLHGFCSTDMEGRVAGYRRLHECAASNSLPPWLPGTDSPVHFGRCERTARLAAVGGLGQDPHAQSPAALLRGGSRARHQQHGLRARFHDCRPVLDSLPVGGFSKDQGRDQDAHADRPERADPSTLRECQSITAHR